MSDRAEQQTPPDYPLVQLVLAALLAFWVGLSAAAYWWWVNG